LFLGNISTELYILSISCQEQWDYRHKKHLRHLWRRVKGKKMPTLDKKVKSGNLGLENDPRSGRPCTANEAVLKAEIGKKSNINH
jgi:hypothetical protein